VFVRAGTPWAFWWGNLVIHFLSWAIIKRKAWLCTIDNASFLNSFGHDITLWYVVMFPSITFLLFCILSLGKVHKCKEGEGEVFLGQIGSNMKFSHH